MKAEDLRAWLQDDLDVVEEDRGPAEFRVMFYATKDRVGQALGYVCSLRVYEDGTALSSGSSCLPGDGWISYLRAYERAAYFVRMLGLKERRAG